MANQVRVITDALNTAVEKVITLISVNVTAELIEATPVDTGWARANWVPAIGAPKLESVSGDPQAPQVTGAGAQQQAALAKLIVGYRLERGPVFISNNVPYITILNEGTSSQAPSGFVQASIAKGIRSLGNRIPR